MVCFAFPHNAQNTAAMDSALALLQRISDRGNSNMATKVQLLKEIRSKISISTVEAAGSSPPITTAAETGVHGQTDTEFPRVDNAALDQMFYSTDTTDLPFWDDVYTNMDTYAEYNLRQWTGTATTNWGNSSG
jgi:hypothetical protein